MRVPNKNTKITALNMVVQNGPNQIKPDDSKLYRYNLQCVLNSETDNTNRSCQQPYHSKYDMKYWSSTLSW